MSWQSKPQVEKEAAKERTAATKTTLIRQNNMQGWSSVGAEKKAPNNTGLKPSNGKKSWPADVGVPDINQPTSAGELEL